MIILQFTKVEGAKQYRIYRTVDGKQEYVSIAELEEGARYYINHDVDTNQKYHYLIEALDANGNLIEKMEVSGWTKRMETDLLPRA